MAVHSTYTPPAGSSDSIGWTCQQQGRRLDMPEKPGVATDTYGNANDVGVGAADRYES